MLCFSDPRNGILGHQFNKILESFALLHAIHNPYNWRLLKKTILSPGFKNPYKKISETKNSSLFMNSILQSEIRKPDKNSSLRRLDFTPRNLG
jgi:hypothetical protein